MMIRILDRFSPVITGKKKSLKQPTVLSLYYYLTIGVSQSMLANQLLSRDLGSLRAFLIGVVAIISIKEKKTKPPAELCI